MTTTTAAKNAAPEKQALPDPDEVLAVRDAREASGSSTTGDARTARDKGPSRMARLRARLHRSSDLPKRGRSTWTFWRFVLRVLVIIFDYVIVTVSATMIVPALGAWLHQQSNTAGLQLNDAGVIALWLMPFAFITVMLAVAEIAWMRWMWRAAGRVGRTDPAALPGAEFGSARPAMGTAEQKTLSPTQKNRGAGRKKRSK